VAPSFSQLLISNPTCSNKGAADESSENAFEFVLDDSVYGRGSRSNHNANSYGGGGGGDGIDAAIVADFMQNCDWEGLVSEDPAAAAGSSGPPSVLSLEEVASARGLRALMALESSELGGAAPPLQPAEWEPDLGIGDPEAAHAEHVGTGLIFVAGGFPVPEDWCRIPFLHCVGGRGCCCQHA
jgi:hypothetical protein